MHKRISSIAILLLVTTTLFAGSTTPQLRFPVDCQLNDNCYIQFYVDHGIGTTKLDHQQGQLTNDAHSGTDIAVATYEQMRQGISVFAAADGTVLRTRDGMADNTTRDFTVADNMACGNGIIIDHGNDWVTQYCHLKQHSLRVKPGDKVKKGDIIGNIGASGLASFPHLHFTVRHENVIQDPFVDKLWQTAIPYTGYGLIDMGLSDRSLKLVEVLDTPPRRAHFILAEPAIVAWARTFGLQKGDKQQFIFMTPQNKVYKRPIVIPITRYYPEFFSYGGLPLINHITSNATGTWQVIFQVKRGDSQWQTLKTLSFTLE